MLEITALQFKVAYVWLWMEDDDDNDDDETIKNFSNLKAEVWVKLLQKKVYEII